MKKIVSMLLVVCMVAALAVVAVPVSAANDATISVITPEKVSLGDEFEVSLAITSEQFDAAEIYVKYNKKNFSFVSDFVADADSLSGATFQASTLNVESDEFGVAAAIISKAEGFSFEEETVVCTAVFECNAFPTDIENTSFEIIELSDGLVVNSISYYSYVASGSTNAALTANEGSIEIVADKSETPTAGEYELGTEADNEYFYYTGMSSIIKIPAAVETIDYFMFDNTPSAVIFDHTVTLASYGADVENSYRPFAATKALSDEDSTYAPSEYIFDLVLDPDEDVDIDLIGTGIGYKAVQSRVKTGGTVQKPVYTRYITFKPDENVTIKGWTGSKAETYCANAWTGEKYVADADFIIQNPTVIEEATPATLNFVALEEFKGVAAQPSTTTLDFRTVNMIKYAETYIDAYIDVNVTGTGAHASVNKNAKLQVKTVYSGIIGTTDGQVYGEIDAPEGYYISAMAFKNIPEVTGDDYLTFTFTVHVANCLDVDVTTDTYTLYVTSEGVTTENPVA